MRALTLIIGSAAMLCGCTTANPPPWPERVFSEATPLCAALENPKLYVGRRLLVRGYLTQTPEGREFWDQGCPRGFLPVKLSPQAATTERLASLLGTALVRSRTRPPRVAVVYSGTLTDNSPALICQGLCSQFTLKDAEIVAVGSE